MRKIIFLLLSLSLLISCSSSKKSTSSSGSGTTGVAKASSGDGSSFDNAIVIQEKSEGTGVDAEYKWLAKNYPGYTFISQSLSYHNKKPYDILSIKTSDGEKKDVYFDISNFYGKF